jgi:hypothetical protein
VVPRVLATRNPSTYAHKEDCKIGVEFLFLSWDDVKGIWGNKSLAKPKMLQMVQPKNQSEI